MIKLYNRSEIDDTRWNARVAESANGLPYALTDYLDIVCNGNWCALIEENYEAIFPLPIEDKIGLRMFLQPPFTQQLGLIARQYSVELELLFLEAIPQNTVSVLLKGNEINRVNNSKRYDVVDRTNFVLPLSQDYQSIRSNYSKSLRKRIKKSREIYHVIESEDVAFLVSYYRTEMQSRVGLNDEQYKTVERLISYLLKEDLGSIYLAKNGDNIEGALFVIKYQNRIINLFGTSNRQGKKKHAMHFILDDIIESNSQSERCFDFEGSDLKGVKEFYQSFGPEERSYPQYSLDRLPFWFKMIKKMKAVFDK